MRPDEQSRGEGIALGCDAGDVGAVDVVAEELEVLEERLHLIGRQLLHLGDELGLLRGCRPLASMIEDRP